MVLVLDLCVGLSLSRRRDVYGRREYNDSDST